jgi:hypothetical protein
MWPWEHLAVGYLTLSLLWRTRGRPVDGRLALALAVGTQFPDLVDKPLAWQFALLTNARSLAHSLFVAVPLGLLVLAVAARRHRPEWGVAFAVGYITHLFGDALPPLVAGHYGELAFLVWPALPLAPDRGQEAVLERLRTVLASPEPYLTSGSYRTLLLYVVVVLWVVDGAPVAVDLGRYLRRTCARLWSR